MIHLLMFWMPFPIVWGHTSHVTSKYDTDLESYLKYDHFDPNIDLFLERLFHKSHFFILWGAALARAHPSIFFYDSLDRNV